jgi:hypothetical protein
MLAENLAICNTAIWKQLTFIIHLKYNIKRFGMSKIRLHVEVYEIKNEKNVTNYSSANNNRNWHDKASR